MLWAKRIFAILLIILLVYQIKNHDDLDLWWDNFLIKWQNGQHQRWLVYALLLMPINWFLEISKWRLLVRHDWQASWMRISKAVFAGISVSLISPNRIGEYAGRVILVPKSKTTTVVLTTFIGNVCQWLAFICTGWPALVLLLGHKKEWSEVTITLLAVLIPIIILAIVFWSPLIFRFLLKLPIGQRLKWLRWGRLKLWSLKHIRKSELIIAFFIALIRLFVYSLQYLFLLWFFDISLTFWLGLSGIFSIYLIQAGIPLPPGLGVITKSELAIWIWGSQMVNPVGILSATFSLYLINLFIPALLGSWLIVKKENSNPEL